MNYPITHRFISKNRSGKPLNAKGTVLHETATPGASDEAEFNYFNSGNRNASAHAFVDYDSITQTIPWDEQAWHAGSTANKNYIGIELCHYDDEEKFQEVWKRAVWLFAWVHVYVIKQTSITKDTLMSHAEVSNKWRESTHQDPIAYFAQFSKTVDDFRSEVQSLINNMTGGNQEPEQPEQPTEPKPVHNTKTLELQRVLNRLKIRDLNGNSLVEDGIHGRRTKETVRRLQSISKISVDGIAGTNTWNTINTILDKPLLKVGSKGTAVRYIQYRVGAAIDGIFGKGTKAAVKAFQRNNGLAADGIVGPNTWAKLIG